MASLSLRVYQKINPNAEFSVLLENKKSKESLLFQAGTISSLAQLDTDVIRGEHYGRLMDVYGCLGVLQVCPSEHTQLYLMVVTRCIKICNIENSAVCKIQEVDVISLHSMRSQNQKPQDEEPWIRELKKLLGNESYYFSVPLSGMEAFDITLCAQRRAKEAGTDNRFFWNRMLHLHPKRFGVDTNKWLIKVMCGGIEFSTLYMNNHTPKLFIISRLSCERAGTRFNVRGVNDAGHVANFVETEQLILVDSLDNLVLSYIQIRGTVPLFWEQPGLNVGSHKVKMSREPEVSVQAFRKHVRYVREKYGEQVVLNLLGTGVTGKRQGEAALSHLFQFQHLNCQWSRDAPHIVFDFHQECRGTTASEVLDKKLRPQIRNEIECFGFFCSRNDKVERLQSGVMRTNCLDCLDRTNRVQSYLALDSMHKKLEIMGVANSGVIVQRFTAKLEEMWKENGNRISQNYAGTGALQGSKLIDGARSAGRMIQNNLLDNSKQEAIDIMLHGNLLNNYLATLSRSLLPPNYLYAPLNVLKQTCDRAWEFCESISLRVAVGTFNVNGGKHFRSLAYKHLSLDDWLLDSQKNEGKHLLIDTSPSSEDIDTAPADVFAIGFEEIVDLTAQNIVQNTQWSENANSWGRELQKVISRDEKYVMVTWKQLVGVALFVFVHEKHAGFVRDVSVETVKTGMQGATGNKGGVGIRMVIRNTSMAFLCSHFAAGQKEVNERNNDYDSIVRKLVFNLGVPLWAHDYVFWCGDFNYRIGLPRDEVVDLIQRQEWGMLLEHDQLKVSQRDGKCFKGFVEGEVNFLPTYKYDLFSDDYDTSEKCRVPAWTDRVLFWARQYPKDKNNPQWKPGKIIHYGRAELKQSDHRPVLAIIDVEGKTVVERKRTEVYQSVVESLGPTDCTVVIKMNRIGEGRNVKSFISEEILEDLKAKLEEIGKVVLLRFVDNTLLITFKDSQVALKAVALNCIKVGGHELLINLKTEDWRQQLQEELALCGDTTIPLLEEKLEFVEHPDANISLDNVEGVMEQFYLEEQEADCMEHPEPVTPTPPEALKPARPAPPKPIPSRPPPPRPTPPGSVPASPAQSRVDKLEPTEKPQRPVQLFSPNDLPLAYPNGTPFEEPPRPPSVLSTPNPLTPQSQSTLSTSNPLTPPSMPSRTPSLDSPFYNDTTKPPLQNTQSLPSLPSDLSFRPPPSGPPPGPPPSGPPPGPPPSPRPGLLSGPPPGPPPSPRPGPPSPPSGPPPSPRPGPPSSPSGPPPSPRPGPPSPPSGRPPSPRPGPPSPPSGPPPSPRPGPPPGPPSSPRPGPPSSPRPGPPSSPRPGPLPSSLPPGPLPSSLPPGPPSSLPPGPPPTLPPRSPSHVKSQEGQTSSAAPSSAAPSSAAPSSAAPSSAAPSSAAPSSAAPSSAAPSSAAPSSAAPSSAAPSSAAPSSAAPSSAAPPSAAPPSAAPPSAAPPSVPSRILPPLPARNLPPVPPRK